MTKTLLDQDLEVMNDDSEKSQIVEQDKSSNLVGATGPLGPLKKKVRVKKSEDEEKGDDEKDESDD